MINILKKNKLEGPMPPITFWKDTGLAKQGPNDLQRMYFLDKIPPEKRPHLHTQDILLSIGGVGSGKTFGGVVRLCQAALQRKMHVVIASMNYQMLKRNCWDPMEEIFTIEESWDHPAVRNKLHDQNNILRFHNNSKMTCINLAVKLDEKIGYNADLQMVDEVHLLPDESALDLLITRSRGTNVEINQLILCTNPTKSKDSWLNDYFDLKQFDNVDLSQGPYEGLVGPKCRCQYCTICKNSKGIEAPWVLSGEDMVCSSCGKKKAFFTWKGKKYWCPGDQQYTRVIKSESFHNPHLKDDFFQVLEDKLDPTYFEIMVKGKTNINLRDDYTYRKYNEEEQVLPLPIYIDYEKDIYWGLDFNRKPQASTIWQFEDIDGEEKFLCKEEICLFGKPAMGFPWGRGEGATVKDVAKEFTRRHKDKYQGSTVFIAGDPKGNNKSANSDETSYEIIMEYLEEQGFYVEMLADDSQISRRDRIELVDYWLEDGLIRFNPGKEKDDPLAWTQRSFKESKEDEKDFEGKRASKKQDDNVARSLDRRKVKTVSHFHEASGYLIWKMFPKSAQELRSATLSDGTVITEDRKGKVKVGDQIIENPDEYWEKKLKELKAPAPLHITLGANLGISIPRSIIRDP
jgi:hypothetical protein